MAGVLSCLVTLHADNNLITHWEEGGGAHLSVPEGSPGCSHESASAGFTTTPTVSGPPVMLTVLTLSENRLAELPSAICSLTALTALEINGNLLCALPSWFSRLTALETLSATHNQLATVPEGFEGCCRLRKVLLSSNRLREVPLHLCRISSIATLRMSQNGIQALPRDLGRLKNLEELTLSDNQLGELPPILAAMPTLTHLALQGNPALPRSLPPGMLQKPLQELKAFLYRLHRAGVHLDMSSLELCKVPESAFADLAHLQELHLRNNQLSELPPVVGSLRQLTVLDIRNNRFAALPEFLLAMTSVTDLEIGENPLDTVPAEIYAREQNPYAETLRYMQQVRHASLGNMHTRASFARIVHTQGVPKGMHACIHACMHACKHGVSNTCEINAGEEQQAGKQAASARFRLHSLARASALHGNHAGFGPPGQRFDTDS